MRSWVTKMSDKINASVVTELLDLVEGRLNCIKTLAEMEGASGRVVADAIKAEAVFGTDLIGKVRNIYGLSREQVDDFDCPSRKDLTII